MDSSQMKTLSRNIKDIRMPQIAISLHPVRSCDETNHNNNGVAATTKLLMSLTSQPPMEGDCLSTKTATTPAMPNHTKEAASTSTWPQPHHVRIGSNIQSSAHANYSCKINGTQVSIIHNPKNPNLLIQYFPLDFP